MKSASSGTILLAFILSIRLSSASTCYSFAGVAIDSAYKPCNGTAPVSMCCHFGSSENNGDICGSGSTYGLCGITGPQLWRESCTDPTWESPACLKLCTTGAGAVNDTRITACEDGSYCCGQNNATCCDAGQGMFIVNNQVSLTNSTTGSSASSPSMSNSSSLSSTSSTSGSNAASLSMAIPSSPSTSSSSSSSPSTSTQLVPSNLSSTSSAATPTSGPETQITTPLPSDHGLAIGTKVGTAVGVAGAVLAMGTLAVFLLRRRRDPSMEIIEPHVDQAFYIINTPEAEQTPELDARYATQEMDGIQRPRELP